MAILSFICMNYLAYEIVKEGKINNFTALCISGIACFGLILGLCLGLLFA